MTDGQKSVEIRLTPDALVKMKANHYNLCFARKVKDTYNVVWKSADKETYLGSNTFSWKPEFQFFVTNSYPDSPQVMVADDALDVGLGSLVEMDKYGELKGPGTGPSPTAITFQNDFGDIHPVLAAVSVDGAGNKSVTPIYAAQDKVVMGTDSLTPVDTVLVWFEQKIATGTMFSEARSRQVEIDLTTADHAVRLYDGAKWTTPMKSELEADPVTILTVVAGLTAFVGVVDLAWKINSLLTGIYSSIRVEVSATDNRSVVVTYGHGPGATAAELHRTRSSLPDPALNDRLAELTLEALAKLGVGCTSLQAIPA
ncbi:hypothetical protein [Lentzea sp. NEAU-D7]|uniref:hypothetical protein n=1 Tax=Lentzea sp. NEAU-D7 TaxID=2994667 RepID=UPI00224A7443|nr:hypothetical protein [Lentzea sp. NEAU-D7]MCX2949805.1 hypothetical protein [Lentzea sp. NEAU-D7]